MPKSLAIATVLCSHQPRLALLRAYTGAAAVATPSMDGLTALLQEVAPGKYGPRTAERLAVLAHQSCASPVAVTTRSHCLQILIDQVCQTQAHLGELERDLAGLIERDESMAGLQRVPEFGTETVAVLRAELGDVARFRGARKSLHTQGWM